MGCLDWLPISFSPVAGIHLIATLAASASKKENLICFSPVAGIHLIATWPALTKHAYPSSFSPVAGIHLIATKTGRYESAIPATAFQSRCRDSFNCDRPFPGLLIS